MNNKNPKVAVFPARIVPLSEKKSRQKQKKTAGDMKIQNKNQKTEKKMHAPITRLLTKMRKDKLKKQSVVLKKNIVTKDDILDEIIINFPRAVKLMLFLQKNSDALTWNNSKQLVLYGNPIAGSDITTILNAVLTPHATLENVTGSLLFVEALKYLRASPQLVVNTRAKNILSKK